MATGIIQGLKVHSMQHIHNLQAQANRRYITQSTGNNALKIGWVIDGAMFAETQVTGLTIGNDYIILVNMTEISSNIFKIKINSLPNDNASMVAEIGYGLGERELSFTATSTTMYLAIGDENSTSSTYSIVDNVSLNILGIEGITNSDFETDISGWYAQNNSSILTLHTYNLAENIYLENATTPTYDANNAEHVIIPDDQPYTDATFNNVSFTNFYIRPGNYPDTYINLTASGTANKKRTIELYNGNDTHPGALPKDTLNLAHCRFRVTGSFWILDRISYYSPSVGESGIKVDGGTDNIFNRIFMDDCGYMYEVNTGSDRNTIQNSRFSNMIFSDAVAMQLYGAGDAIVHKDNKFINNEVFNCNDGVQLVRSPSTDGITYQSVNFEGTIINGNKIYLDSTVVAGTEDAWDIKGGSANQNNPVIISNNIVWGYNGLNGRENFATVYHYNPRNVHTLDNFFFDCGQGIYTGGNGASILGESESVGMIDCLVERNTQYDCGKSNKNPMGILATRNTKVRNNATIDSATGFLRQGFNSGGSVYEFNDICNTPNATTDLGGNDSQWITSVANNTHYATATAGGYTSDFIFTKDEFTANPIVITLTNAIKP